MRMKNAFWFQVMYNAELPLALSSSHGNLLCCHIFRVCLSSEVHWWSWNRFWWDNKGHVLCFLGVSLWNPFWWQQCLGTDQAISVQFGRVLAHGFLSSEMLPTRIASPPTPLACSLMSKTVTISDRILLSTFLDVCLPMKERLLTRFSLTKHGKQMTRIFCRGQLWKASLVDLVPGSSLQRKTWEAS